MRNFLTIALVCIHLCCIGQSKTTLVGHSDCSNAYELSDSINGPYYTYGGSGKILEFSENDFKDSMFVAKETNTIWFKFHLKEDCELNFDIIPEDINQDLDFMLYKVGWENYCEDIINKIHLPLRSNISRNDKSIKSWTGCSSNSTKKFVHSGPGEDYCNSVQGKKDDNYLLMIDAPNGKIRGVKIRLPNCVKKEEPKGAIVKIINADDKSPVYANVNIDVVGLDPIISDSVQSVFVPLNRNIHGEVRVDKSGMFPFSKTLDFKINEEIIIELIPIEVGRSLQVTNLHFVGDKADFLPKSFSILEELRNFMLQNETVHIEIQGHVNDPDKPNSKFDQDLSEKRAEAVYLYLIENGVEGSRMTHKGFGNTEMINPHFPLTQMEMAINRRVEIVIVEIR